jgi:uncharacterized DUF497 family protein
VGRSYEFEWDSANTNHLARHEVTRHEFEQAFKHPRVEERYIEKGEQRIWALGKTDAGRYLTLVYTVRGNRLRAVTAYTTKRKYRKIYDEAIQTEANADDPEV